VSFDASMFFLLTTGRKRLHRRQRTHSSDTRYHD